MIVLDGKAIYLADLFGGENRLHDWDDMERDQKGQSGPRIYGPSTDEKRAAMAAPRLPAAAPTVRFSRILKLNDQ